MTTISHGTLAKGMAELQAGLRYRLHLNLSCDGSDVAPTLPYLLDQPSPGQRQPVKAVSRRSRARKARALRGWSWSDQLVISRSTKIFTNAPSKS